MTTEKKFQTIVPYGGILLAICVIGNLYLVLRFREVYRDRVAAERQVQKLALEQQVYENVLRGFIQRAANDPKVAEILQRHQAVSGARPATAAPGQELKP